MKIALVHELLTMKGGAERVLKILAEQFPDAPIYTLLYNEKTLGDWFPRSRVRPSILQPSNLLPFNPSALFNHHHYLDRFPAAVEAWDFSEFDVVLSTSSAFVHGIITNGKPKHLCYVHSPARYLWDRTHDVVREASRGMLGPLKRWHLERTFHRLRSWDAEAAERPDALLAASRAVQRRIELYWRRESEVLYPPIDNFWLDAEPQHVLREHQKYFLIVSTLARYKRIDLAIHACNALNAHLKIVGEGPDRLRLERLAGPTIEFYGRRSNDELADLYGDAIATIFPGDEDFGIVPLESMVCGTPVIAYRAGGALETILEGRTGEFFDEPTPESLQNIMERFEPQNQSASGARFVAQQKKYSKEACREHARQFSKERFLEGIQKALEGLST